MPVSRNQILQLLGHAGLRRIFANHGGAGLRVLDVDEDDDDSLDGLLGRRRRRPRGTKAKHPPVPSEEGRKLMTSGTFGSNEYYKDILYKRKPRLARRLMSRELGQDTVQSKNVNGLIAQVWLRFGSLCLSKAKGIGAYTFFEC